jgi:hypothetical protein
MFTVAHASAASSAQLAFINSIPDFTQTDITEPELGYGSEFCGPVAAANSLYWLNGNHGDVKQLAVELGSPQYMNIDIDYGTTIEDFLHGIDVIARNMFGGYRRLEYQGFSPVARRYTSGKRVPNYQDLVDAITPESTVWIGVGWYRYDPRANVYHHVGGHWVTLVGYDRDTLVLHDPSPRAGEHFSNEFVKTSIINSGKLSGDATGLPVSARGYIRLGDGMHIKWIADTAIIDGAVIFYR